MTGESGAVTRICARLCCCWSRVGTTSMATRSDSAGEGTTPTGLLAATRECPIRRCPFCRETGQP